MEIQRGDGRINLLRLLKRLHCGFGLVQSQKRAAHHVISCCAVVIEIQCVLTVRDGVRRITGKQVGVREIQPCIKTFRDERRRLEISGDSVGEIAAFKITIAARHQLREGVGALLCAILLRASRDEREQEADRGGGNEPRDSDSHDVEN